MFNIALFGTGRIGKVHAEIIDSHPEINLYSVIDPYLLGAESIALKYQAVIQSIEEAMTDENVHAVCIASATDTHADLIELAAKNGKAIFCEKPIDLSLSRIQECLAVVNEFKVPFLVGFNRRFDPNFSYVKEQFSQGKIGKAESLVITSRDPLPPPAEYCKVSGGMFRDMSVHDLDMARYMIGEEPISITVHASCVVDAAIGEAGDVDTATIVLGFPSGASATIINSRRSGYGYDQRLELHGEKGLLKVDNQTENLVQYWGEQGCTGTNPEFFFLERYNNAYIAEWKHFADILAGRTEPCCSGIDGQIALQLAEVAEEAARTKKTITLNLVKSECTEKVAELTD
ncbi:inositol 2-dehydrogenase [Vibrio sp. DW001]|uniref:inositol 2-dehydrogenase n=1 Tax=Vibrio sp. DW001 TaxID=2912315 RepID=UPI0023B07134|nr:inositol 2-dehydrogenase [Vibrio sp. DW001]WED25791.1 inositol 2-dehydrogenase [Vibrio sp. DW001]